MDIIYLMATMSSISCQNENCISRWFVVHDPITIQDFFSELGIDRKFYCTIVDGDIVEDASDKLLQEGSEIRLIPRI